MAAYYNEHDPFAAAWLKELIKAGQIVPGEVDERSIEDVLPSDLRRFTQCHFFAGIGVWSYALRCAGWPDDRPVWTGSCPCQPFSAAGKRGGVADERHLWPAFYRLIRECSPRVVFGEQVASKDGLDWFSTVSADLEAAGYAVGGVDLCAAGFGAPHIRQRLYFVGTREACTVDHAANARHDSARQCDGGPPLLAARSKQSGIVGELADTDRTGTSKERQQRGGEFLQSCEDESAGIGMADSECSQLRTGGSGSTGEASQRMQRANGERERLRNDLGQHGALGLTNGFWSNAKWIPCRDGKYRPIEPGSSPLATGIANRVGKLRGYGNALTAPVAQGFIEAYLEVADSYRGYAKLG